MSSKTPSNFIVPNTILGIPVLSSVSGPLFRLIGDSEVILNNPHFIQIRCLIPQKDTPICEQMTITDTWITDGKVEFVSAAPRNTQGISQVAWEGLDKNAIDWRSGGEFSIKFPKGGVFWLQSRGADLRLQTFVVDTRWVQIEPPSDVVIEKVDSKTVKISWKDNSEIEVAFHVLIEQYVGGKWVRIPYLRVPKNVTTATWKALPGYYRFAVRAGVSNPEETWTFKRVVSADINSTTEEVAFKTGSIIKYSAPTSWSYFFVDGLFQKPLAPTNFGGTIKNENTIFFVWQDNSNEESTFHILEDKWVNEAWVRQQTIKIPANRRSYTTDSRTSGKYRYAIRSAYSFPNTNIVRTSSLTNWIEFTIP